MPDGQGSLKSRENLSRVQASVSQRSTAVKWTLFHGLMALRASARTSGGYPSALAAVMPHGSKQGRTREGFTLAGQTLFSATVARVCAYDFIAGKKNVGSRKKDSQALLTDAACCPKAAHRTCSKMKESGGVSQKDSQSLLSTARAETPYDSVAQVEDSGQ